MKRLVTILLPLISVGLFAVLAVWWNTPLRDRWHAMRNLLKESDAILLGTIVSHENYNVGMRIPVTRTAITVEESLKVTFGPIVTVEQHGGAYRLANGDTLVRERDCPLARNERGVFLLKMEGGSDVPHLRNCFRTGSVFFVGPGDNRIPLLLLRVLH